MNSARLMSEKEMMKAKMNPEIRLDWMSGSATLRKACTRLAPRHTAASSSCGSSPARPAIAVRTTKGAQITTCAHRRLVIDRLMPHRAEAEGGADKRGIGEERAVPCERELPRRKCIARARAERHGDDDCQRRE